MKKVRVSVFCRPFKGALTLNFKVVVALPHTSHLSSMSLVKHAGWVRPNLDSCLPPPHGTGFCRMESVSLSVFSWEYDGGDVSQCSQRCWHPVSERKAGKRRSVRTETGSVIVTRWAEVPDLTSSLLMMF